jgi:antibiotic biosynthesis monooxygenase (ABM) superfamily enzyme
MGSDARRELIDKAAPLLVGGDDFHISSGLDFWFTPAPSATATPKVPVRWKQFLITGSAIYPLMLLAPMVVQPLLHLVTDAPNIALTTLVATALIVFLMVYVIMPRHTRMVQRWLFS